MYKELFKLEQEMDIYAPSGYKVKTTKERMSFGRTCDEIKAIKYLTPDVIYEFEGVEVCKWHIDVYLKDFQGVSFNSAHFIKGINYDTDKKVL